MPFEPELIPEELPDLHFAATRDDPQLRELDFEGNAAREAEREAASQPEPPAAPVGEGVASGAAGDSAEGAKVEPFASPADMLRALQAADADGRLEQPAEGWTAEDVEAAQDFLDEIEDLAEEDPLAAADMLAQAYAAHVQSHLAQQYQQELAPIQQQHFEATAASTLEQIAGEFGADVVAANAEAVAQILSADEAHYADPATQQARVRDAFIVAEHNRQVAYARGDDVYAEMDALPAIRRDAFGQVAAVPAPQPQRGQAPQASHQAAAQAASRIGPVHVEGGSTPPPPDRSPHVDPVIAEMDATMPGRDLFGRLFT
jgi:hypothetical protein